MGFVLFTESGTFNPLDYGLSVGDIIFIKAVGGGGGGTRCADSSASYYGTAGESSSFGSIVTAAGGLPGRTDSINPVFAKGSNTGGIACQNHSINIGGIIWYYGATGGDGWMPGFSGSAGLPAPLYFPVLPLAEGVSAPQIICGREFNISTGNVTADANSSPSVAPYGHAGTVYGWQNGDYKNCVCAGGVGYGAGGGSGTSSGPAKLVYGYGGSSGVIVDKLYKLTSIDPIAITVGNGGAGYREPIAGGDGYRGHGGGGARGCVAVWW